MAYTGPKKFKKKVGNKTVRWLAHELFHRPGKLPRQLLFPVSRTNEETPPTQPKTRTVHCARRKKWKRSGKKSRRT